ncbi:hypothetical protein OU5_6127 [Pseudomonas mandelii JR-1]|uniref:Uncharacterized protein n=1 Tax=Pseudomonas mandelii JR-1 TaxID=1147786 RepID=A0A024EKS3_9PSED|nr:hypothetical protein OU5_6127 [Pseudomonas mandelii JR-1]
MVAKFGVVKPFLQEPGLPAKASLSAPSPASLAPTNSLFTPYRKI